MRLFSIGNGTWSLDVAGVLLDADGTLVDSTPVIEHQWRTFLGWYGLPPSAFPDPLHGKRAEDHIRDLVPADEVQPALDRFVAMEVADSDGVTEIAGAAAFLEALTEAGCPWAVVTSGMRAVAQVRLAAAGLPVPAVLVAADDVTSGKPDPMPFLVGRQLLGGGTPGSYLAFEDAPAGIASARGAGCLVVAVSSNHTADELSAADHIVPDLRGLTVTR